MMELTEEQKNCPYCHPQYYPGCECDDINLKEAFRNDYEERIGDKSVWFGWDLSDDAQGVGSIADNLYIAHFGKGCCLMELDCNFSSPHLYWSSDICFCPICGRPLDKNIK